MHGGIGNATVEAGVGAMTAAVGLKCFGFTATKL